MNSIKSALRLVLMILLVSFIFACGIFGSGKESKNSTEDKQTSEGSNTKKEANTKNVDKNTAASDSIGNTNTRPGKPSIKWEITPAGTGQYDTPINEVNVTVNGIKHFLKKEYYNFNETPVSEYKTNDIPPDAITACRGWWAGAGIDYWVLQKGYNIEIYSREIGETIGEDGEPGDFVGKPVLVKTIKLDE